MSRVLKVFFAVSFCLGCFCNQTVYAKSVATELNTGTRISLESEDGETVITNLGTGESINIVGEYEGMTDLEYTELMEDKLVKNEVYIAASADIEEINDNQKLSTYSSGSSSGRYTTSGPGTPNETNLFYINTTSANVTITQDTNYCTIHAELMRSISFWPDTSYGTKYFSASSDTETWSGLAYNEYYYLVITKVYDGYWTYGDWSVTW